MKLDVYSFELDQECVDKWEIGGNGSKQELFVSSCM